MTDDIVSRLRESDGGYFVRKMFTEAADEIERLRGERDEARRRNCELLHEGYGRSPEEWAERKGWDCFKENKENTDD